MRRVALRGLLAALASLALGAPASASALSLPLPPGISPEVRELLESRADTGIADPSRKTQTHQFTLRAARGFKVLVIAEGNSVVVEVGRKGDHAFTAYAVKGKVTPTLVRADLGELGSISMRFHPSRARGAVQRRDFCRGVPRIVRRHGTYTGSVRLRGEGNYFAVGTHRAEGRRETAGVSRCFDFDDLFLSAEASASRSERKGDQRRREFFASWREGGSSAIFGVVTRRGSTQLVVLSEQSFGRMAIFHLAAVKARARVFALDDAITRAKLTLRKAPFHGEGIYTAAPDGSTSWEGSLAVDFPGAPDFPLTGPQFDVELDAGF